MRQRVAKPPFQETHLLIEEAVPFEVLAHFLDRYRQLPIRAQVKPGVVRILPRVRRRHSLERIYYPHPPIGHTMRFQKSAHEDRRPTAPYTCLEKITGDVVSDDAFDTELHVVQPGGADHGVGEGR